jgi:UDP-N-acetyl-D-glucosamine dehydrogenase
MVGPEETLIPLIMSLGQEMNVTVVGLGKIGLPLAVQFASNGFSVTGLDLNSATVDAVNRGIEPFPGEALLQERLAQAVREGKLRASNSYETAVSTAKIIVVVVPLVLGEDERPDFKNIDSATSMIARFLSQDSLIIYETTLPIGTTRNRFKAIIENESGLVEGDGFFLAFSPERVLTGRVFADLRRYPKLVGGVSPQSAGRACDFYTKALDFDKRPDLGKENGVWDLGSAESAEMAKLLETTYRDVNIGLANQFALHAEDIGVNIYKIIEACNSQGYSHIHQPGISVGGHCIPVYPRLYLSTDNNAGIVLESRMQNLAMPSIMLDRFEDRHGSIFDKDVVVLGATYRAGVKEDAYSGVYDLVDSLVTRGARPTVADPLYEDHELLGRGLNPVTDPASPTLAIFHTDHWQFKELSQSDFPSVRYIIDGRGMVSPENWPLATIYTLGLG